ncbi:MAG: AI-2E family transporter [Armatimonadetes bacterium]|nr:AI-2E family transporter [Armatimonadota bacterium]
MNAWRIALWVGIVLLILAFLWSVRGVLPPFVIALVIAVILEPVVRRLRKMGVSRPLAVSAVLVAFFLAVVGVILLTAPYISQQYNQAKDQVQTVFDKIATTSPDGAMQSFDHFLVKNRQTLDQLHLPTTRQEIVSRYIDPNRKQIEAQTQSFLTGGVVSILSVAGQAFMFFLTPVFVFGLLIDLESIKKSAARFIPPSIRAGTLSILGDIGQVFENYLRGLVTTIVLYTIVMCVLLGAWGAPYFIVLALVAGILYLIPVVGGVISSVCVFLVVGLSGATRGNFMSTDNSWIFAAATVGLMFLVGTVYDSVVNPRIVGQAVKLNPVVSAFVVFASAALFGLPGMLCAYPVAGAIKVVLDRLVKFTGSTEAEVRLPAVPLRHRQAAEA